MDELSARLWLLQNPEFEVGDVVECRTANILYDGVGEVIRVSHDPKDWGTPVHPSFRVALREKANDEVPDEVWYTAVCLKKVDK